MLKLLDKINTVNDLNILSIKELKQLASEIRDFIISTVADNGGHLAPNLGVVELTIALHYHLNSPKDKIIWDVGHQSYAHKILTGRKDDFQTIRQYQGLSGYPKIKESIHDQFGTGHSSTSISAALGLALARDLKKETDQIYAVIGDGALTGGMAFEALNHAGHMETDLKVILNDNAMSIAPNVGALSQYLTNLRTDPTLSKLREDLEFILNRIPKIGTTVSKSVERLKDGLKYLFLSGVLFEEMGFTYIGPLDGHNIEVLINNFKKADRIKGPVLIHVNTQKGKGYSPAENEPCKYHGVSPFQIANGESKKEGCQLTYSQVFGQTMLKLAQEDEKVVAITAAMPDGTGLCPFRAEFPERFFDVGIAEQHALTLATGLAKGGQKPVFAVYSSFLQRAYDQVIHDACLQNLPITIALDRAGIVGSDGETHQGVFDISFLRLIPNIVLMAAKDEQELQDMLYTAVNYPGPAVVRYPRGEGVGVELAKEFTPLEIGKAEILKKGEDILVIAVGSRVYPALQAAEILAEKKIKITVINARFIKPLDHKLLLKEIKKYKRVITVEEQVLAAGFSSAILELINDHQLSNINIKRLGLPDHFIPQGEQKRMEAMYKIDSQGIVETILEMMEKEL